MTPSGGALNDRRWRAPRESGQHLLDPPLSEVERVLRQNEELLCSFQGELLGHSFQQLRLEARQSLWRKALNYTRNDPGGADPIASTSTSDDAPLLLSGHQPDLYHAGVWFKNFVLARLSQELQGRAVHLLIDNDLMRQTSVRVPSGTISEPFVSTVEFDRTIEAVPYEERRLLDTDVFRLFPERVQASLQPYVRQPVLRSMWPTCLTAATHYDRLGEVLAAGRRQLERRLGVFNAELPLSHLCNEASFLRFAVHLFAELKRFLPIHNAALDEYRRSNRIRSRSHPVPALRTQDGLEAPFWLWTKDDPRRRAAFVRILGRQVELSDRHQVRLLLDLSADQNGERAVQQLLDAQPQIVLRPRALTTTLYLRLFLSDLFIHGIGGGKYDQLTDLLMERFYGVAPPTFMIATATLKLPVQRERFDADRLRTVERELRDLEYHPEKFATADTPPQELVREKEAWIHSTLPKGQRKQRHEAITRLNRALADLVGEQRVEAEQRRTRLQELQRRERILGSREFSFALFPEESFAAFLLDK